MKNFIVLTFVLLVAGGAWYLTSSSSSAPSSDSEATKSRANSAAQNQESSLGGTTPDKKVNRDPEAVQGFVDLDERPAAEIYKSAEEALSAVKKGAKDYDDIILEQFVEPGDDCSWCPDFYSSLEEMMASKDATEDEKAYYSEILAISGKVENIKTLVDSIVKAGESEDADIFAESLELTIGGDDVVQYLKEHINSKNELLQESVVAAITNQGSRFAAETLYDHTKEKGDPDGYYSLGIGLAEMIPDDETLPYLQDLMLKRDQYSHLAVKALLNHGIQGLEIVMDGLTDSKDGDFDRAMLVDAIDHVNYEDDIKAYLQKLVAESSQPVVSEFAKEILEDFDIEDDADYDDEDLDDLDEDSEK
ncbi:MAG: hypothetical protein KDD64_08190 [Bdellovibrionales bacterium]|nr:hypothetical protein [Bdellovibrionales bacterium]